MAKEKNVREENGKIQHRIKVLILLKHVSDRAVIGLQDSTPETEFSEGQTLMLSYFSALRKECTAL